VVKLHAFLCQAVDVWSLVDARSIAPDGFGSMIISHDEYDIWSR
jgi:hypothetical protein